MSADRGLGLDELMIINPGADEGAVFLGDDGVLYRIRALAERRVGRRARGRGSPRLLLGDDGMVYGVRDSGCGPGLQTCW